MKKLSFEKYTESEAGQRLLKLLMRNDVYSKMILDADEFCEIVPEAQAMVGFDQRNPHHPYDIWVHTAHCVASSRKDPVLRLALLMHDSGKPSTFYFTEDDVGHFNRHEARGEKIVRERLPSLGFDADTVDTVAALVRNHDKGISDTEFSRWLSDLGEKKLSMLFEVKEADARSHDAKYKKSQLARVVELRRILNES